MQKIHEDINFELIQKESREEEIDILMANFIRPFKLDEAPLFRAEIVRIDEECHILFCDMHHIISDGLSMNIIIKELEDLYYDTALPELTIQYKDYAVWQNSVLGEDTVKKQDKYWIDLFKGEIPVVNMPSDYPRPALKSFEGDRVIKRFDETVTARLRRLGQEAGATLYMVLLAIFNITVSKYTSQEDIIIGTPVSTRGHSYLNNIVGLFINMLAMRNCANGYKTFSEFLGEVKENAIRAFENRDYQFEELVSRLNLKRDMSRNPLFDIVFALQNNEAVKRSKRDISIIPRDKKLYTSKFDITLNVIEMNDFLELEFEYCTKLFKKETIERFISCFENITKEVIDDPNLKLSDIKPIPNDEIYHIIHDFNDTAREYEKDKTIHGQFEEQAARTPDGIAVIYGDKGITYRELNEKANRIARRLREKGTVRDSIVGIMVDRSIEMIIGIMAVLKAGGAYLPIDPSYPRDRISFMIKDSGTRILLTEGKYLDTAACVKGEVIDIRDAGTYHEDGSNVKNENAPEDLAYVIYTSGSTGKPKGVMIEHRSVITFLPVWRTK